MVTSIGFRANIENYEDFQAILAWCRKNGSSFNSVINSLIPAVAYTLRSNTMLTTQGFMMRCDFGDVPLKERQYGRKPKTTEIEYLE